MEGNDDNGYEKRWPGEFDGYRRTATHDSFTFDRKHTTKIYATDR